MRIAALFYIPTERDRHVDDGLNVSVCCQHHIVFQWTISMDDLTGMGCFYFGTSEEVT